MQRLRGSAITGWQVGDCIDIILRDEFSDLQRGISFVQLSVVGGLLLESLLRLFGGTLSILALSESILVGCETTTE